MVKVDNAVILAAGFSSRFVPISFDIPKGLIHVKGETLIERQIRQLQEKGIYDIYIITGFMAEKFSFLSSKYKVNLIYNPEYAIKNNYASLLAAKEVLKNTIISSSDLFFSENIFTSNVEYPYFASVYCPYATTQRCLKIDNNGKILNTQYGGKNTWITFGGLACLTQSISHKLIEYMEIEKDIAQSNNKYWVDFQDEHLPDLPMYIKKLKQYQIREFNSLEDLRKFDSQFRACSCSSTMQKICNILGAGEHMLSDFVPIKKDNKVTGCSFKYNGCIYNYDFSKQQLEYTTC